MTKFQTIFLTLEGIEGSGKSSNAKVIYKILEKNSINYVATREPGGSQIGSELRKLLLKKNEEISSEVELLLMLADRKDHVEKLILPKLNDGNWIVSDRFMDSTIAYQGGGRGLDIKKIELISNLLKFPEPNCTILFDLPVEEGLKRVSERGDLDRFENESIDFHKRVRKAYLNLAKTNPQRIKVIDSSASKKTVEKEVCIIINELINGY